MGDWLMLTAEERSGLFEKKEVQVVPAEGDASDQERTPKKVGGCKGGSGGWGGGGGTLSC